MDSPNKTTLAASLCVSGAAASTSSDVVPMGMPVDAGAVPVAYPADAAAPTYYPPVAPLPAVPAAMPMAVPTVTPVAVPVVAQQPSWNRGQQTERVVMDEIRSLFRSLDTDGNKALDLKEFVTGAASLGLPPGSDPVKAFELLDVDGSGELSLDELCLAIGPDLLAAKQQGVTATACLTNVIANLHVPVKDEASATAVAAGEAAPALVIATPIGSRPAAGPEERDLTCGDYFAALLPCYLCCCSTYGGAVTNETLQGLPQVLDYVVRVKEDAVQYSWTIQCYHYETRTRFVTETDSEGRTRTRTETYRERVNTHYSACHGRLATADVSETFVPATSKLNVALKSELDVRLTPDFMGAYSRARNQFYSVNRRDMHQDTHESFSVPSLVKAQRIQWVEGETPCWATDACMYMSALLLMGPCWLYKMQAFMGMQAYTFHKSCGGWMAG